MTVFTNAGVDRQVMAGQTSHRPRTGGATAGQGPEVFGLAN